MVGRLLGRVAGVAAVSGLAETRTPFRVGSRLIRSLRERHGGREAAGAERVRLEIFGEITLWFFRIGPSVRSVRSKAVRKTRVGYVASGFPSCSASRTREEVTHLTIASSLGSAAPAATVPPVSGAPLDEATIAKALDAATIAKAVVESLDDSKAEDIVVLDIAEKSSLADTMIVASGRSHRHVGAIADRLLDDLSKTGAREARIEGMPHCDWVLIDLGDVLVHLFRPEVRGFYALEKMWASDGPAPKPAPKAKA
jgi:ribosome-associated protein